LKQYKRPGRLTAQKLQPKAFALLNLKFGKKQWLPLLQKLQKEYLSGVLREY